MTMIFLLGIGAVLVCAGIAAWKIYGPQPPTDSAAASAAERDGKNWVATDFAPGTDPASPHSPAAEPSSNSAETGDSGA